MKRIILYGSKYGTTKRYAEELARRTGIPCRNCKEVNSLSSCKEVIHLGGIYAGQILGLAHTVKLLRQEPEAKLLVATVGPVSYTHLPGRRCAGSLGVGRRHGV